MPINKSIRFFVLHAVTMRGCSLLLKLYIFARIRFNIPEKLNKRKVCKMAKYEQRLTGNFDELLTWLDNDITKGSFSAAFEDGSDYSCGQVRVAVRVYERYSMMGGNRVSLSITVVGQDNDLFVSAITAGGSQAVFIKINTLGETSFLDKLIQSVENFISRHL